jgi:hypothetical protein
MTTLIPKYTKVTTANRTIAEKFGETLSVKDYGATGDGTTDDTVAIQAGIDAVQGTHNVLFFPAGTYKVTDTLAVHNGTQLRGVTDFAYPAGFGRPVYATTISFQPTTTKDLFDYSWTGGAAPGFIFHTSMSGLNIEGNANSRYGIKLNSVIYSLYENMAITGFQTPIYCSATINNRFCNLYLTGSVSAVTYAGSNETTDVWEQCSFWGSPIGVSFLGSSINVRFSNCLLEQIDNYGFDIAKECQAITVTDCYTEDVPFKTTAADAAVFRVGYVGTTLVIANNLIISGGSYAGRSAGLHGSFLDTNFCYNVIAGGFDVSRYVNVIKTDATNTEDHAITLLGYAGISWTNNILDSTKVGGMFANGVLNTGSYNQALSVFSIATTSSITSNAGYYNAYGTAWLSNIGSPEGVVTAPIGSLYTNVSGGVSTTLYVKTSGAGNTGWTAK